MLKTLETPCKSLQLQWLSPFDNLNIMGPVRFAVVLPVGKPSKRITGHKIKTVAWTRCRLCQQRGGHSGDATVGLRDGLLTPPDLIVNDGGQGQVNVSRQVIQEELGPTFPSQACKRN